MELHSFKTYRTLAAILWLLVGSIQLWQVRHAPIGDFANYYYASQALSEGVLDRAQLYEPYTFNIWVNDRAPTAVFVNYAPVPPISALAYLPIAQVADVYQAKLIFNIVGLVFFVLVFWWGTGLITDKEGSVVDNQQSTDRELGTVEREQASRSNSRFGLLLSRFSIKESMAQEPSLDDRHKLKTAPSTIEHGLTTLSLGLLLSPFILWTPLYNNLYQGQSYLYILAFLWLGFLFWRRNWWVGAAMIWALPISLKIFPAIILLFLLLKRQSYTLGWTVVFSLLFSVLPMIWIGYPTVLDYYQDILPRLFAGEINDPYTILYQSARVFFDQLFVYDGHLNPTPILDSPILAAIFYLIFQWVILSLLVQLVLKKQLSSFLAFGLVVLAGLLVSGYGSNYSMLLLFFPALSLIGNNAGKVWLWGCGFLLFFLAGNIAIYRLQEAPFILQFPRMYALIFFVLWIYYWERPPFKAKVWIGLGILLLVKFGLSSLGKNKLADYYLPDGSYPIIFDYQPTATGLLIQHFRGQGAEENTYSTSDNIYEDQQLKIIDDQVYYGNQRLSHSKSRKKKPLRLNEQEVIYLSDEGRGVGFYTIRKLSLP